MVDEPTEAYAQSEQELRWAPLTPVTPAALWGLPGFTDFPAFSRDLLRDWLRDQVRSRFPETVSTPDECGEQIHAAPAEIPEPNTSFLAGQKDSRQLRIYTTSGADVSGCGWDGGCAITTYTSNNKASFTVNPLGVVFAVAPGSGVVVATTTFVCIQEQKAPKIAWGLPVPPVRRLVSRTSSTPIPVVVCGQDEPLLDRATRTCHGPEVSITKTGEAAAGGAVYSAVTNQLSCGPGCIADSAFVPYGLSMILGAGAPPGTRIAFNGWGGDCSSAGTSPAATLVADARRSCSAEFVCEQGTTWDAAALACACTPTTCAAAAATCGTLNDGCSGTLNCGACNAPESCGGGGVANQCGGSTSLIDFYVSVDDYAQLLIDGSHVAGYDAYPWGEARGTVALTPGWHDIRFEYANRWGSTHVSLYYKRPSDTGHVLVPRSSLRSLDSTGATITGLRADYQGGGAFFTVFGEAPIQHGWPSLYQGVTSPTWAGLDVDWGIFAETLSGQILID